MANTLLDVLIVGAGPAGSFLGYLLARCGYAVQIIDKEVFPREKVCGGGISHKTVELLPFDLTAIVQKRIQGAFLTYQNHATVVKDLGERGGVSILRSEFDNFLLQQAIAAGAVFHGHTQFVGSQSLGDCVRTTTSRGTVHARYLVGADGVMSHVRESVFGRGLVRYVPAVEALVSVAPEMAARLGDRMLFDFGGMPRGYGWIFPKKDHLNVGVYSLYPRHLIKRDLELFMGRYRILKAPLQVQHRGFVIPVKNTRREYERDHVLLLGDAAGFAESFYGEGIYYALKSATLAAKAFSLAFDHPAEQAYSQLVRREIEPDLAYSALNARLFFSRQKFGYGQMVRNMHVNHYFAELIGGQVDHRECFYKTIVTAPYWLFSKKLPPWTGGTF